jgi:hypothetical protein
MPVMVVQEELHLPHIDERQPLPAAAAAADAKDWNPDSLVLNQLRLEALAAAESPCMLTIVSIEDLSEPVLYQNERSKK